MKINKKQSNHKSLLILVAALAIIGVSSLSVYVFAFNGSLFGWSPVSNEQDSIPNNNDTLVPDLDSPPTEEQVRDGESIKEDSIENEGKPQNQTTTVRITTLGQSSDSGTVSIRALIQKVTNQGTCTLTMTNSASTLTRSVNVQSLPNGSTCQGFDIPKSELAGGIWNVEVEYSNGDDFASDEASIEVQI